MRRFNLEAACLQAIRFVWINDAGDEVVEDEDVTGHEQATNNKMEFSACVEALERAARHHKIDDVRRVVIFTDSRYVADNLSRAKFQWSTHRWSNQHGRPVENAALWKDLVRAIRRLRKPVDFEWVKGHAKDGTTKPSTSSPRNVAQCAPPLLGHVEERRIGVRQIEPPSKVSGAKQVMKGSQQSLLRGG